MSKLNNPQHNPDSSESIQELAQKQVDANIDKLVKKIIGKYEKSQEIGEYLAKYEAKKDRESLKSELAKLGVSPDDQTTLETFYTSSVEENKAQRESTNALEAERANVESEITTAQDVVTSKFLPQAFMKASRNPTKPHHHITGAMNGALCSVASLGVVSAKLVIDTCKAPLHLFQIAKGEAVYDISNV